MPIPGATRRNIHFLPCDVFWGGVGVSALCVCGGGHCITVVVHNSMAWCGHGPGLNVGQPTPASQCASLALWLHVWLYDSMMLMDNSGVPHPTAAVNPMVNFQQRGP